MPSKYNEIKTQISEQYAAHYLKKFTSEGLAEDIKSLTVEDIIEILEDVKKTPEFLKTSHTLSRKSDLFDKIILMKGEAPHDWVLRLHIYNMVRQSDEPGYVISNLDRKIRDDENHIHEHSWQLTSRVLLGGIKNHQYIKTEEEEGRALFNCYNLVPTAKDGVSNTHLSRKAIFEKQVEIFELTKDLYQQGDLVHYPIEIPHKVDTQASAYLGMTITLAHTSERHHENSLFYEKAQQNSAQEQKELDVEAQKYTEREHYSAINLAITTLKLMKLCDTLAKYGFDRFNRFLDPLSKQATPNNVLETELLPTIAMILIERENFVESPMTDTLKDQSQENILKIKKELSENSPRLIEIIDTAIKEMDLPSLKTLIQTTQQNLLNKMYTPYIQSLPPDAQEVLERRRDYTPQHVLDSWGFFSDTTQETAFEEALLPLPLHRVHSAPSCLTSSVKQNTMRLQRVLSGEQLSKTRIIGARPRIKP